MAFSDSEPQFQSYRPKSYEKESKNASEDIPNELKKYPDAPLVKDRVSDNKDCSVESPVVVEKKTDIPSIAKVEFVRPKQQEKPLRKPVKARAVNTARPRLVNTARPRAVNNARPREVNTARPNSAVVNAVRANQIQVSNGLGPQRKLISLFYVHGHPQKVQEDQGYVDNECSRHMTGNMSYLSNFKEFDERYVTFGGGAKGGRITGKGTLQTVNTARPRAVNNARPREVNTARPNSAVVNAVRANQIQVSNGLGPQRKLISLFYVHGHPQKVQEDQGYVDNECSRHMTGNMSYLSNFKEFDERYVTFGGGAKGGRITGKGTLQTVNPIIYTSCIKQFWATVKVKIVVGEEQIQALVDKKKVIITETNVRSDLYFKDGADSQVEGMLKHKEIYVTASHTKTIFDNTKRLRKDFLKQKYKKSKKKITEDPQLSDSTNNVVDKHVTTASNDHYSVRMIDDLDADEGVALVDETQGRNDQYMFNTSILDDEEVLLKIKLVLLIQFLLLAKDKGKAKMIEPEKPLKKKDHIMIDEEVARNLEAQLESEIEEEERLARQKEEEANIMLFNNTMKWIESFVPMDTKLVKGNEKAEEGSSKRAGGKIEQKDAKRQRLEKENESAKLKRYMEIILDDEDDVTTKSTLLSSKSPTIVDYKIYKEGRKSFFKIIRADGNSQNYLIFRQMFKNFNREDLEVLWSIVKARFKKAKPVDDMGNLLFQTLKIMFEHHVKDNI
nr:hypothetical protein [Tanacetum cinerariifolium]